MDQDSIRPPEITNGSGYGITYTTYLHSTAWMLRKVVASLSGSGKLFDKIMTVPTPGLGESKVSIAICIPQSHSTVPGPWPVLLVAQGGGFILGQPSDGEHIDRAICKNVGVVVISVEYAKSPRYPYPHALLQLYEVLKWALSPVAEKLLGVSIDPSRVAVMGNSAGGNLMASLSLLLSFTSGPCALFRKGLPFNFRQVIQVLIYPCLDLGRTYNTRLGDCDEDTQASSLPSWATTMMEASYLPPYIDKSQIFIAPLAAEIPFLRSLQPPSAFVVTAGKDCLKLEAKKYSEKLSEAGVSVVEHEYPEVVHGFSHHKEGSKGFRKEDVEDCWERISKALKASFSIEAA